MQAVEPGLRLIDGNLRFRYAHASLQDGLQGCLESGVMIRFRNQEAELVVVGAREVVGGVAFALTRDVELGGVAGGDFDAEAVDGRSCLGGFWVGDDLVAAGDRHFENDGALVRSGVMDGEVEVVRVGAVDVDDAFGAVDQGDVIGRFVGVDGDMDGLVCGVGEQAFFAGVDGIEEAFAAKGAGLHDGEAASVEREV